MTMLTGPVESNLAPQSQIQGLVVSLDCQCTNWYQIQSSSCPSGSPLASGPRQRLQPRVAGPRPAEAERGPKTGWLHLVSQAGPKVPELLDRQLLIGDRLDLQLLLGSHIREMGESGDHSTRDRNNTEPL